MSLHDKLNRVRYELAGLYSLLMTQPVGLIPQNVLARIDFLLEKEEKLVGKILREE